MSELFMGEWLNTVQMQVRFKPDGHLPRPTEINLRYTFHVDEKRIRSVTYRIPVQDVEIDESDLKKSAIVSSSSATANGATTISTTKSETSA